MALNERADFLPGLILFSIVCATRLGVPELLLEVDTLEEHLGAGDDDLKQLLPKVTNSLDDPRPTRLPAPHRGPVRAFHWPRSELLS